MPIGDKIRERRIELNMTQEELALKMGYKSKSTINKIELGVNDIPLSKVKEFADVLHTTEAYLMGWEDEPVEEDKTYYLNPETAKIAQELYERPELRILFDASRDVSPEDLLLAAEIIKRMSDK